ncbi:hypothetical protein GJV18_15550 [Pseudomonas sp. R-22-3w-18]|uniref:ABC-2 family transporter protein n=1 Tax=Pseudomonas xionganensis TaxID=2654845 RepID=A0A6I4KWC3_9PSED|nr:hypothetical protein [Pseudomonas xionganensis]
MALKARFIFLAFGTFLVVALAMLMSSLFSGRQPATVALDVGLSITRLLFPLLIVLLVQELLSREFDKRYYLTSLSYPHARNHILFARVAAVICLVSGALLSLGLFQIFLMRFFEAIYPQATQVDLGVAYWTVIAFVFVDFLVLIAVASLLAVVASTPSFVLIGTFGFMLVARSYGAIIELLGSGAGLVADPDAYRAGLGVLGYLFPDLGGLDVRMLALYGKSEFLPSDWHWLILSCLGYAIALLAMAVWALQRKRFA